MHLAYLTRWPKDTNRGETMSLIACFGIKFHFLCSCYLLVLFPHLEFPCSEPTKLMLISISFWWHGFCTNSRSFDNALITIWSLFNHVIGGNMSLLYFDNIVLLLLYLILWSYIAIILFLGFGIQEKEQSFSEDLYNL